MTAWFKAFRLPICVLASLLVATSFRIANIPLSTTTIFAVLFIACSTMLQNDWRDRYHDVRKGKVLVVQNTRVFFLLLLLFWTVSSVLTILVFSKSQESGLLLCFMGVAGMIYSEVRRVPMASILLTAITSASPVLFVITNTTWILFFSVVLVIFGREITKDLEDKGVDEQYKWTLPVVMGDRLAKVLSVGSMILGLTVAVFISLNTIVGLIVALYGIILFARSSNPRAGRVFLDTGLAITILTLMVFRL